jgi:hypothetical protein
MAPVVMSQTDDRREYDLFGGAPDSTACLCTEYPFAAFHWSRIDELARYNAGIFQLSSMVTASGTPPFGVQLPAGFADLPRGSPNISTVSADSGACFATQLLQSCREISTLVKKSWVALPSRCWNGTHTSNSCDRNRVYAARRPTKPVVGSGSLK